MKTDWIDDIDASPPRKILKSNQWEEDTEAIKPRKIPPQNLVYRIRHRETHACRSGTHFHVARKFHTNLFPNFTVVSVEKPPCFLRKFSPDGRHFIAFSADQTSLEIYEFQGPAAAEEILQGVNGEFTAVGNDNQSVFIRGKLFEKFFRQKYVTSVASNGEHLNRECSLFTDDGKYVIVGSAVYIPDEPAPHFFEIYRNNEAVTPNSRSPLEDYTLHLVEIESGRLSDSRHFKCDKIFLSHNQGLYLYRDTLAVLSVQQQTIHIFQVTPDGSFIDVRTIGRFCYEDDQLVLAMASQYTISGRQKGSNSGPTPDHPYSDRSINSLKHRLLVHLFDKATYYCDEENTLKPLRKFYQYFDQFCKLRMWKMQLLDENHLLIKYASEEVVTLRTSDPNSQPSFFVVYNMVSTEVIAVFENTSEQLLELFENFCDMFRNATLHCEAQFTCSASSNLYARQIQQRFKQTIINAKFGGN